jgi:hypothetical protein
MLLMHNIDPNAVYIDTSFHFRLVFLPGGRFRPVFANTGFLSTLGVASDIFFMRVYEV